MKYTCKKCGHEWYEDGNTIVTDGCYECGCIELSISYEVQDADTPKALTDIYHE